MNQDIKYPKRNSKYGWWIKRQRNNRKIAKIDENQKIKMELLPNWRWDRSSDEAWNELFDEVRTFIRKYGHYPNSNTDEPQEKSLGVWVIHQRVAKKGGKSIRLKMTEERVKSLESLPNWTWGINRDKLWENQYAKLKEFFRENKRYPKSHSINSNEKTLAQWIQTQKTRYRCKLLSEDRIINLESLLGWKWSNIK